MSSIQTIAIGQGGGPTSVVHDQVAGSLYEIQRHPGLRAYVMRSGLEGFLHADAENVIDITDWDHNSIRADGPGNTFHWTRFKIKKGKDDDIAQQILSNMGRYSIDNLVYIGGNDSGFTLASLGMGVHATKTIDNDLLEAHHVSGFGSAALFNATMIRNLVRDLGSSRVVASSNGSQKYATAPLTIYQTMGRNTGWLALATALARVDANGVMNPKLPPDIIWPREIPFDEEQFLSALSDVLDRKGKAFVVIGEELVYRNRKTIAEVYQAKEQELNARVLKALKGCEDDPNLYAEFLGMYGRGEVHDQHGHVQHARSGAFNYADYIAMLAKGKLKIPNVAKIKETPIVPQHLQRAGYVKSQVDSEEAFEVGREAVRAILDGQEQVSIVIKSNGSLPPKLERVPISAIAGKTRNVPLEYIDGIRGPTQAFVDEFLPIIGGPAALPHYTKLDTSRIVKPRY